MSSPLWFPDEANTSVPDLEFPGKGSSGITVPARLADLARWAYLSSRIFHALSSVRGPYSGKYQDIMGTWKTHSVATSHYVGAELLSLACLEEGKRGANNIDYLNSRIYPNPVYPNQEPAWNQHLLELLLTFAGTGTKVGQYNTHRLSLLAARQVGYVADLIATGLADGHDIQEAWAQAALLPHPVREGQFPGQFFRSEAPEVPHLIRKAPRKLPAGVKDTCVDINCLLGSAY